MPKRKNIGLKKIKLKPRKGWAYFDEKCRITIVSLNHPGDFNSGWRMVHIVPNAKALYRWKGWTGDE